MSRRISAPNSSVSVHTCVPSAELAKSGRADDRKGDFFGFCIFEAPIDYTINGARIALAFLCVYCVDYTHPHLADLRD